MLLELKRIRLPSAGRQGQGGVRGTGRQLQADRQRAWREGGRWTWEHARGQAGRQAGGWAGRQAGRQAGWMWKRNRWRGSRAARGTSAAGSNKAMHGSSITQGTHGSSNTQGTHGSSRTEDT